MREADVQAPLAPRTAVAALRASNLVRDVQGQRLDCGLLCGPVVEGHQDLLGCALGHEDTVFPAEVGAHSDELAGLSYNSGLNRKGELRPTFKKIICRFTVL